MDERFTKVVTIEKLLFTATELLYEPGHQALGVKLYTGEQAEEYVFTSMEHDVKLYSRIVSAKSQLERCRQLTRFRTNDRENPPFDAGFRKQALDIKLMIVKPPRVGQRVEVLVTERQLVLCNQYILVYVNPKRDGGLKKATVRVYFAKV